VRRRNQLEPPSRRDRDAPRVQLYGVRFRCAAQREPSRAAPTRRTCTCWRPQARRLSSPTLRTRVCACAACARRGSRTGGSIA
jgi:hypothetical protein